MDSDTRYQIQERLHLGATLTALLAVAAVWAILQGSGLGRAPFHTRGEPREAVVVQDLVARGDWILPRRNGVGLPRKPPLFYWLAGLTARVRGGVDEATMRLPSALMSGAAALLLTGAVAVSVGAPAALLSGVVLLSSFEWLRAATAARVDMTLAFGLTAVFVGLLLLARGERRAWRWLVYFGAAWATLAKGSPGLAIPALYLALLCGAERSLAPLRRLRPLIGLAVVLLSAGAWYAVAAWRGGRPFIAVVLNENVVRLVGGEHFAMGHEHSVAYLIGALAAGLLPWTPLLPAVAVQLWRARATVSRTDPRLAALLWSAAVLLPHALATSKRGVYLLPLYPSLALLIGWWMQSLLRGAEDRIVARGVALLGWIVAALLALLAIAAAGEWLGVPLLQSAAALLAPGGAGDLRVIALRAAGSEGAWLAALLGMGAAAAVVAAVAARASSRWRWGLALTALAVCAVSVSGAVRWSLLPAIAAADTRAPLAADLRRLVGDAGDVATAPTLDYGLLYYWGSTLPVFAPDSGGAPPRYLVLPETQWLHLTPTQRRGWHRVPGMRIERGANQGYLVVIERVPG